MRRVIMLRYGEIHLKGKNRAFFENMLINNVKQSLDGYVFNLEKISGRYVISNYELNKEKNIINKLTKVFGLISLSIADEMDTDLEVIKKYCSLLKVSEKTFRVTVKRADKRFAIKSCDYEAELGGYVLDNNPDLKVDLKKFELELIVELRENKKTYILTQKIKCHGGMPVGTAGKGLLLLSGGIDSPVAGYMMAKRGMPLMCLHFHSYPYTSEMAKQKVISLAKKLKDFVPHISIYFVKFTKVQEEIHKNCSAEFMITIMRRIMMRIAERLCFKNNISAIITGESLGQVASQTIEGITSSNNVVKQIPVLRPLIGFDKSDITEIAQKIDTFETSILPYEDCCTVFLPDNPVIKPKLNRVEYEESKLDVEALIDECLKNIEIMTNI